MTTGAFFATLILLVDCDSAKVNDGCLILSEPKVKPFGKTILLAVPDETGTVDADDFALRSKDNLEGSWSSELLNTNVGIVPSLFLATNEGFKGKDSLVGWLLGDKGLKGKGTVDAGEEGLKGKDSLGGWLFGEEALKGKGIVDAGDEGLRSKDSLGG